MQSGTSTHYFFSWYSRLVLPGWSQNGFSRFSPPKSGLRPERERDPRPSQAPQRWTTRFRPHLSSFQNPNHHADGAATLAPRFQNPNHHADGAATLAPRFQNPNHHSDGAATRAQPLPPPDRHPYGRPVNSAVIDAGKNDQQLLFPLAEPIQAEPKLGCKICLDGHLYCLCDACNNGQGPLLQCQSQAEGPKNLHPYCRTNDALAYYHQLEVGPAPSEKPMNPWSNRKSF